MTKKHTAVAFLAFSVAALSVPAFAGDSSKSGQISALSLSFAEEAWDGKKVPTGQQCQKFGGNGQTPKINVNDIPRGTEALIFEYSDHNYRPNDHGGHGKIGYKLRGETKAVTVPAIAGHSFELPKDFFLVEAHRGKGWDLEGAYMPPCSGGNGHIYYVTVKAVNDLKETSYRLVGEGRIDMGVY